MPRTGSRRALSPLRLNAAGDPFEFIRVGRVDQVVIETGLPGPPPSGAVAQPVTASGLLVEDQFSILDRPRKSTMPVLDRLYSLEEAAGIHTSYALQNNYEPLLRTIGVVAPSDLARATERMMEMGDPRDVQAAYHSLRQPIRVV